MEAVCAPFFCSASEHAFTLHSSPFLRPPPVFIGIPRGEEFTATLHPLFTTLHHSVSADLKSAKRTGARRANSLEADCKSARTPSGLALLFTPNGCVISLDVGAQQLTIACTSPVVRPKIQTVSTTYPYSSNNNKRVNHKLMTHPPPNQPR